MVIKPRPGSVLFNQLPPSSSRHPHEVFLAALSMLSGTAGLFEDARPGSVQAVAPTWLGFVWSWTLILGGLTCLVGVSLSNRGLRLLLERTSMVFLGSGAPAYSFAVIVTVGWRGLYPASITAAFGAACIWRWVQITRELNAGHQ